MNGKTDSLEGEIRSLKYCYRSIEAPPYLAPRIRARVQGQEKSKPSWSPAIAAIAVAISILSIWPLIHQEQDSPAIDAKLPSMTMLSRLTLTRPTAVSPSLGRVRSYSVPPMPVKPKSRSGDSSQPPKETHINQALKENPNEYV